MSTFPKHFLIVAIFKPLSVPYRSLGTTATETKMGLAKLMQ